MKSVTKPILNQSLYTMFYVDDVESRAESTPIAVVGTRHRGNGLYLSSLQEGHTQGGIDTIFLLPRDPSFYTRINMGARYAEKSLRAAHDLALRTFHASIEARLMPRTITNRAA